MLRGVFCCDQLLIVGKTDSFKTTLAFGISVDAASKSLECLYICNKSKIESKFPRIISESTSNIGTKLDLSVLGKVAMKYVGNFQDLKVLFAGLHAFVPIPDIIIIEDFSQLIDPFNATSKNDSSFLDICLNIIAIIHDAIKYIEAKSNKIIQLVITDNCVLEPYISSLLCSCQLYGKPMKVLKMLPIVTEYGKGVHMELNDPSRKDGRGSVIGSLVTDKRNNDDNPCMNVHI